MIMGGVQSKVLVAILEKNLCKHLLRSYLGISALSGEGEYGYVLELHNSEKM